MPRRPGQLRPRRSTTAKREFLASIDLEERDTWPPHLLPWQRAAIEEGLRELDAEVGEYMGAARVLDEADEGVPRSRILSALGQVHTLNKAGGGFIRYQVPADCNVRCEEVGCCDPRRTISAGRL
jgi:hypothetical protein